MHHHTNNRHSTSNFNNPQHHQEKPEHMHFQYGRNDLPNPQRQKGPSFISKIKGKFQEKPATAEEVRQLGLNAKRETYKTAIQKAKSARPGRFDGITGGGGGPSYRRSSSRAPRDSGLFGGGSGGSFLDFGEGPSLSFLTGSGQTKGRGKKQDSGFGKGLQDLF